MPGVSPKRPQVLLLAVAGMLTFAMPGAPARREQVAPLVGANYTQLALDGSCGRRYILLHGQEPGERLRMVLQLASMRAAGIDVLRFFVWHDHDGAAFESIPSAGGRLVEPYRSNFIAYMRAARSFDFKRVEIVFGPVLGNDPEAIYGGVPYDPSLFDENWSLIKDVHALAKEYGPPTRFDLLNEGAPSDAQPLKPQIMSYLTRLYRDYVDAFGNEDVTVSVIDQQNDPTRLTNLLAALRASGRPMPTFFEVHPDYAAGDALRDLKAADAILAAAGLDQPLEIGEGPYDDAAMASAVQSFIGQSTREVTDVLEWPLRYGSPCRDFSVPPPYRADAYISRLRGATALAATHQLTGSVSADGAISLIGGAGPPVTALEDGSYTLRAEDRSARRGFVISGPGVARKTGARFRGTIIWRIALKPGLYRYGATVGRHGSFVVLRAVP